MTRDDVDAVRDIWESRWGSFEQVDEDWLTASLDDAQPEAAYVADHYGRILGFVMVTVGPPDYIYRYFGNGGMRPYAADGDRNGVIHMLAVRESAEDQGIATRLVNVGMLDLHTRGSDVLFAVSWRREDVRDSSGLFERAGFRDVATQHGYYEDRTGCPECGAECECPATFYVRDGDAGESTGNEGVRP